MTSSILRPGASLLEAYTPDRRVCSWCGCSDDDPCHVHGVPCCWIEIDGKDPVCSACAAIEEVVMDRNGRRWLAVVIPRAVTGLHKPFVPCRADAEADGESQDRDPPIRV